MRLELRNKRNFHYFTPSDCYEADLQLKPYPLENVISNKFENTHPIKFFFDIKLESQKLVLGHIPTKRYLKRYSHIYNYLYNFLSRGIYLDYNVVEDFYYNNRMAFNSYIENPVRIFYLTDQFLINNYTFNNPIGAIYSNYSSGWHAHPGTARIFVLDMFDASLVKSLAFYDTNELGSDDMDGERLYTEMSSWEELSEFRDEVKISFTAQFNTIIPHIHLDSTNNDSIVLERFKDIKRFFDENRLVAENFDLSFYGYIDTDQKKKIIKIKADRENDMMSEMQAIFKVYHYSNKALALI